MKGTSTIANVTRNRPKLTLPLFGHLTPDRPWEWPGSPKMAKSIKNRPRLTLSLFGNLATDRPSKWPGSPKMAKSTEKSTTIDFIIIWSLGHGLALRVVRVP